MSGENGQLIVKGFRISDELFTTGYGKGVTPCNCSSVCCGDGVWADLGERERILASRDLVKRHMDETQTTDHERWFDDEVDEDADFPSGKSVGTSVINGKCAFLDGHGRCSLQVAAAAEGLDRWALKPLFCVLFPICVIDGEVVFDDHLQAEQECCTVQREFDVPLFEACRDELVYLLGEDGFAAIRRHDEERRSLRPNSDSQQEHS